MSPLSQYVAARNRKFNFKNGQKKLKSLNMLNKM